MVAVFLRCEMSRFAPFEFAATQKFVRNLEQTGLAVDSVDPLLLIIGGISNSAAAYAGLRFRTRAGAAASAEAQRSDGEGLWDRNGGGGKRRRRNGMTGASPFAAAHIASDGDVIAKEAEHFPSCVRPSRIGIGSRGTAARPSVASSMDAPLF